MKNNFFALFLLALTISVFSGCSKEETYIDLTWKNPPTTDVSSPIKSGSGKFVGFSDKNFIEIEVAGAPKENPFMVFMLTVESKKSLEKSDFNAGDPVSFEYKTNEYGQNVLRKIRKL